MSITDLAHEVLPSLLEHVREGRFERSLAAITAAAGLASAIEVAQEHYTGSFGQRVMYTPPALCLILAIMAAAAAIWPMAAVALPWAAGILIVDCLIGFGFHLRGVARKPGGWRRNTVTNLIMGPPILAPLVLTMTGFFGLVAGQLVPEQAGNGLSPETLETLRFWCATATAVYAALNGCEALYSHYKSRFSRKPQWVPIVIAPLLAMTAALAVKLPDAMHGMLVVMSLVAILAGVIGAGFHLNGVRRRPGGRAQLGYNLIYGPPLFAPLLFSATGLLGLFASQIGYHP